MISFFELPVFSTLKLTSMAPLTSVTCQSHWRTGKYSDT